jgi:transcriptional regulator with XRE-family HTH domain
MLVKQKQPESLFGRFIRQRRRAMELGIAQLAQQSRLDPSLLSRIERGKRKPPSLPYLTLLANSLHIPRESTEFARMLELAEKERHPGLHEVLANVVRQTGWNPFAPVRGAEVVVCASLGELVAKATEAAISGRAVELRVKPKRGRISVFRLTGTP